MFLRCWWYNRSSALIDRHANSRSLSADSWLAKVKSLSISISSWALNQGWLYRLFLSLFRYGFHPWLAPSLSILSLKAVWSEISFSFSSTVPRIWQCPKVSFPNHSKYNRPWCDSIFAFWPLADDVSRFWYWLQPGYVLVLYLEQPPIFHGYALVTLKESAVLLSLVIMVKEGLSEVGLAVSVFSLGNCCMFYYF